MSATAESALERELRALPPAPGPDSRFRAELRLQLMAAVERGSAEVVAAVPPRPRLPLNLGLPKLGLPKMGHRAIAALATTVAVLLVVTGTTWWLAQRALPGDALYGIKRAGESADLSTKQGDQSRGQAYLSLSTTRIDEAAALVKRATAIGPGIEHRDAGHTTIISASGPLSPRVDDLVRGVLSDGDTSAVTATRLLTTASVNTRATNPVTSIAGWLVSQRGTVRTLVARLPETGVATAGGQARILQRDLAAIQVRVRALSAGLGCRTCQFTKHDRLGPLPCRVCPPPPVATPTRPTSPSATTSGSSTSVSPTAPTVLSTPVVPGTVPNLPGTGAAVPTGLPPTGLPTTGLPTTGAPPSGSPPTTAPPTTPAPGTTDTTTPSPTVAPTTPTDTPTTDPVPSDDPSDDTTDDTPPPSDLATCLPPLCISAS